MTVEAREARCVCLSRKGRAGGPEGEGGGRREYGVLGELYLEYEIRRLFLCSDCGYGMMFDGVHKCCYYTTDT
jgi:hypothetical protein